MNYDDWKATDMQDYEPGGPWQSPEPLRSVLTDPRPVSEVADEDDEPDDSDDFCAICDAPVRACQCDTREDR